MKEYLNVLKNYAVFKGRASRREYWMFFLMNFIVAFALGFVGGIIGDSGLLGGIYNLAVLIPGIAVAARRLHDTNRSGWWMVAPIAPIFIGAIALAVGQQVLGGLFIVLGVLAMIGVIVLYCLKGDEGENRFGPVPAPIE